MNYYTLITGATSGIGYQLAFKYANKGHHLILLARRLEILESLKNQLESLYSVSVVVYAIDLSDLNQTTLLMNEINNQYALTCVINNAGIGIFEPINQIEMESIHKQMTLNFTSPVLITKLLVDNVMKHQGTIIFIASVLSYIGNAKSSVYTSTKHAILGFANTLRLEYPTLHILTVHPITVKTDFFSDPSYYQNHKVLTPEVVAKKIVKAHQKDKEILNLPKTIGIIRFFYLLFPRLINQLNAKYFTNK